VVVSFIFFCVIFHILVCLVPCLWNDIDDEDDIDEQDIVTVIFNITVYSSEIQGRNGTGIRSFGCRL